MKDVAKSLLHVFSDIQMAKLLDRQCDITEVVKEIAGWWGYDLFSRKPGPVFTEYGTYKGTDLDLCTFLYELAERGAVINIPTYKAATKRTIKEGQHLTSAENRHGKLVGLTANQDFFKFSVRILDMNVMTTDSVGDFRNFLITDFNGNWYPGWKRIDFVATAKENEFIFKHGLLTGNTMYFNSFVNPNRWRTFYSKKYFITKYAIQRLAEEIKYLNTLIDAMLDKGIQYPEGFLRTWPKTEYGETVGKKFKAFKVEIDIPDPGDIFQTYEFSQDGLVEVTNKRNFLKNIKSKLSFTTRCTELAFYKHGSKKEGEEFFPAWISGAKWERDFIQKGKKTKWDRLILFQPKPFEFGVALRKREYEKTGYVNPDY